MEFTLLGYQPRPWSVVDCLLICLHMYRSLTTTWKDEVVKNNMLAQGDRDKVKFLFPMRGMGDVSPGSNAWAIAGSRTASGKPLLSNDMHLEYSLPGIWYMTHLEAPGLNVAGVSLPGAPGIIVGHNQRIAWGITNLQFDVQDLYIEKLDDRTGRYLFRGQVEQARAEREIIRVKGQARGGDDQLGDAARSDFYFRRRAAHAPCAGRRPSRDAAVSRSSISIARRTGRSSPRRSRASPDRARTSSMPTWTAISGTTPRAHCRSGAAIAAICRWTAPPATSNGTATFRSTELPSVYNPPGGLIVTANQNPFPRELRLPGERQFRAALPRATDSRTALRSQGLARRRICWRCRRTSTRHSAISWRGRWSRRIRKTQRAQSGPGRRPWPCCASGTDRWTKTWRRRC